MKTFSKTSAGAGAARAVVFILFLSSACSALSAPYDGMTFTRQRIFPGFDGKFCKICPGIGTDGGTNVFLTYRHLLLTGCDVFYGTYLSRSPDGGRTWNAPVELKGIADVHKDGVRTAFCAGARYSPKNRRWYSIGHSQDYRNDSVPVLVPVNGKPYQIPYQYEFDPATGAFSKGRALKVPFKFAGAYPIGQTVELDNGDILIGFQVRPPESKRFHLTTYIVKYRFEGDDLVPVACGKPITCKAFARGLYEPSLAYWGGRFFLTLRSDEMGMFCTSDDGLDFSPPEPWRFDDGSLIGNRNTMQHWVVSPRKLYLTYTREGAGNDHVFRNRAPIFMAPYDPVRRCLVRSREIALVPELGARLGNFTVTEHGDERWLATAEWMQPRGCERYGSDNSIWLVKMKFPPLADGEKPPVVPSPPKGRLFLCFDDRHFGSWTNAAAVFARYGAHATFFVNGVIDKSAVDAMRYLSERGHSLGLHGLGHLKAREALAKHGEDGYYRRELKPQLDAAAAAGLRIENWAYPCSDRDAATDALLRKHFKRLRTGGFWSEASRGKLAATDALFAPPVLSGRRGLLTGASIGLIKPSVTGGVSRVLHRLAGSGGSVVLYAHDIRTDGRRSAHDVTIEDLETILAEAKSLGIRVLGMDEDLVR